MPLAAAPAVPQWILRAVVAVPPMSKAGVWVHLPADVLRGIWTIVTGVGAGRGRGGELPADATWTVEGLEGMRSTAVRDGPGPIFPWAVEEAPGRRRADRARPGGVYATTAPDWAARRAAAPEAFRDVWTLRVARYRWLALWGLEHPTVSDGRLRPCHVAMLTARLSVVASPEEALAVAADLPYTRAGFANVPVDLLSPMAAAWRAHCPPEGWALLLADPDPQLREAAWRASTAQQRPVDRRDPPIGTRRRSPVP